MKINRKKFLMMALSMGLSPAVTGCIVQPQPAQPQQQQQQPAETEPAETGDYETEPEYETEDPAMIAPADECVDWDPSGECIDWASNAAPADECVDWDPSGECIDWR